MFFYSSKISCGPSFGGGYSHGGFGKPSFGFGGYCAPVKAPTYFCMPGVSIKPPVKIFTCFTPITIKNPFDCLKPIFQYCPKPDPKPEPVPEPKPDPKPDPVPEPDDNDCEDCVDVDGDNPGNSFGGVDTNPGNIIKDVIPDEVGAIYGTDAKDTMYGTDGDDIIYGKAGADVIYAGNGNDIVYGDNNGDTIYGGYGKDTLYGGDGNDYLNGGQGDDVLYGGKGDDIYMAQFSPDEIIELPGEGIDTVRTYIDFTLPDNVENLILMETADLNGTGNELDNVITGNAGSNVLEGLDGNDELYGKGDDDTLYGGNGDDFLDGGSGDDVLYGGAGDDVYYYDICYGNDTIVETGDGCDILAFGPNISASDLGFSVSGQDLVIDIKGSEGDSITITDWFKGSENQVETFSFDVNGTSWDSSQIANAIQEQAQAQTSGLI